MRRRRARGSSDPVTGLLVGLVFGFIFVVGIPISLLHSALVGLGLSKQSNVTWGIAIFIYLIAVGVVVWVWVRLAAAAKIAKKKAEEERMQLWQQQREQQKEERRRKHEQQEEELRRKREQHEEERRREEQERAEVIEALLERDALRERFLFGRRRV